MPADHATKVCGTCGATMPLSAFFPRGGGESGYRSMCKSCFSAARKERRRRDPAKDRSQKAAWRARNPERYAAMLARRDKARMSANARKWRARNKDRDLANRRAYYQQNLERERMRARVRARARRCVDADALSYVDVLAADPCCYCGVPVEQIDHITPMALGGPGEWTNFTAACKPCNTSKGATPLLLFLLRRQHVLASH